MHPSESRKIDDGKLGEGRSDSDENWKGTDKLSARAKEFLVTKLYIEKRKKRRNAGGKY